MSIIYSTNSIKELFLFQQSSDIDNVIIDCSGRSVLELALTVGHSNNMGGTVTNPKFTLTGSFDSAPAIDTGLRVADDQISVSGTNVTLSNGVVSFSGIPSGSTWSSIVVVRNPPRWLAIEFSASAFPSSPVGSSAVGGAGWR